jgi:hypothetical protein
MPGLVPGIHVFFLNGVLEQDVDGRDICAKTRFALKPGHDELEVICLCRISGLSCRFCANADLHTQATQSL